MADQPPSKAGKAPTNESWVRLEATAAIIDKRIREGKRLPLDVMFAVMDEQYESGNKVGAVHIAMQAAPYVHPKLRDLVVTGGGEDSNPVRLELGRQGMKNLSAKELEKLEELLSKAAGETNTDR